MLPNKPPSNVPVDLLLQCVDALQQSVLAAIRQGQDHTEEKVDKIYRTAITTVCRQANRADLIHVVYQWFTNNRKMERSCRSAHQN